MNDIIYINLDKRRHVTLCNHNFSQEGVFHPDRIMTEYDLLFMQNGSWDIIEDEITYHLTPGSVLILEPNKHHYSTTKCSPMMRNVYIHFNAYEGDISSGNDKIPSGNYLPVSKLIETSNHPEIHHGFERVIDAFWSSDATTKELRSSLYLESLLLQLSDLSNVSSGKTDILVSEIIHRFHCEPDKFFSPDELARDYNVSVRTISGRFKKYTGQSLHNYQLEMKLDMIYDLLPISPGRSLHDISLSYGFYDEFQLSKLFKKKYGISPSKRR